MRILTDNTGRGQLEVLSALAEQPDLKQKQITDRTSLSKGSVSTNVRKLKDKDLIKEESGKLSINSEKILLYYREHLEEFLIRKKTEPEELNEIRTLAKKDISQILETHEEEIWEINRKIISQARERSDIESLNSVFKETDRAIREYVTAKSDSDLRLLAIATDQSYSIIEDMTETDSLENAKQILDEANN